MAVNVLIKAGRGKIIIRANFVDRPIRTLVWCLWSRARASEGLLRAFHGLN